MELTMMYEQLSQDWHHPATVIIYKQGGMLHDNIIHSAVSPRRIDRVA